MTTALAYYRTSSAANVGDDKDTLPRQQEAVRGYAARNGITILDEFYDPAVSGADPVAARPGFQKLLTRLESNGVTAVLVEDPTRFARDAYVQMVGHRMLKDKEVELIPVNYPTAFTDTTPTGELIKNIIGALSQFEKAVTVAKLGAARARKRVKNAAAGLGDRCEGRKPPPVATVEAARRLSVTPTGHKRRGVRTVAALLAAEGYRVEEAGKPTERAYGHEAVRQMLKR